MPRFRLNPKRPRQPYIPDAFPPPPPPFFKGGATPHSCGPAAFLRPRRLLGAAPPRTRPAGPTPCRHRRHWNGGPPTERPGAESWPRRPGADARRFAATTPRARKVRYYRAGNLPQRNRGGTPRGAGRPAERRYSLAFNLARNLPGPHQGRHSVFPGEQSPTEAQIQGEFGSFRALFFKFYRDF